MAFGPHIAVRPLRFGRTARRDRWWAQGLLVFTALSPFVVYTTWAALQGRPYTFGPYLSPFYSPELFGHSPHAWFGPPPSWFPAWLTISPAVLILWAPGGFRLTCYYYRGAYYKAFWADPPSCAVGEPRTTYRGESAMPLVLQNVHRPLLYLALPFLAILAYDVWKAMWFPGFGIGVGTLILAANVVFLGGDARGFHSLLPLAGGCFGLFPTPPLLPPACASVTRVHTRPRT